MTLTLPLPPSTNRLWRRAGDRIHEAAEADKYKRNARLKALAAGWRPVDGPVALHVVVYVLDDRSDLSNRLKCLEDALQGVAYKNDREVP